MEGWLEGWRASVLLRTPLRRWLFNPPDSSPSGHLRGISLDRTLYLVNLSSAYHLKPLTCLERALTCQRVLQRRGVRANLRIGVRKDSAERLDAHAWLEGPDLPREKITFEYSPMGPLPQSTSEV